MKKSVDLEELGIVPERPPSLDEKGRRITIHPAKVKGRFRQARNWVQVFLLFIFLVIPWTQVNGKQTVFLDIFHREFTFFGFTFYAHDVPLIFFILSISVFSIVLATAIWGRAWCGWACPQTVFIDSIYRRIEEWIEGRYTKRYALDKAPWTKGKILKKLLKWFLFLIVSLHIAHSFTAYFVGAKQLTWMSLESPLNNLGVFIFVQTLSLITLVDFGWFKEQFCLIVCPYGRFQSVLMDENSKAVLYDQNRGEPRKKKGLKEHGDCVNCLRCVSACPTGIDIRNGLQLECIACTACADACDEVMEKVGTPKGLIRYSSEAEMSGRPRRALNPRTMAYSALLVILIVGFASILLRRAPLEVKLIRAIEAPFRLVNEGERQLVVNHFKFHLTNQSERLIQPQSFEIEQLPAAEIVSPQLKMEIEPGKSVWVHVFIKFPPESLRGTGKQNFSWSFAYILKGEEQKESRVGELSLLGPGR